MALSLSHIIQLLSFALLMACGQILFKFSAITSPSVTSIDGLTGLVTNFWFWLALTLYAIATLLWILILQTVPLSLAYPFVSLGFIIVPLGSYFLFKEPINFYYIIGTILIIAGLGIITMATPK